MAYTPGQLDVEGGPAWARLAQVGDSDRTDDDEHRGQQEQEEQEEHVTMPNEGLDEDMYGMTVCSLVRDMYFLQQQKGVGLTRYSRITSTTLLMLVCIALQTFLLVKVKHFVSAKAVHDIRDAYDIFEKEMYWEHTFSANGKHRGKGKMKDVSVFYNMTQDDQSDVCRIPLSQPTFFFAVLFIWSLTCLTEVKKSHRLFEILVWQVSTIDSMAGALQKDENDPEHYVIFGITKGVKAVIVLLVIVPRLFITCFLLWLGCRWLLATNNFCDLILNAVALEFILVLKELIYTALLPARSKVDLSRTSIHTERKESTDLSHFLGSLVWGVVAATWVVSYMGIPGHWSGLQQVLPGYNWDIRDVCEPWVNWRYCVNGPSCPKSALDAYHEYLERSTVEM
eukprot:TRINITY_DN27689_c0_g2_i1.p1 TRINITY_DN27689_c0_g2~~TRINITY_DN27689_c0_g2_i1.p1  ORF type:complete len:395 (-),score=60.18 TRINITY_DN27689_c0_g2_i1:128-1312(-)